MTDITPPPAIAPPPIEPPPPPPARFSAGLFIVGLMVSLLGGGVANIFSGLLGMATNMRVTAFLVGAIPGTLCMLVFLAARRNGLGHGMLVGGAIIALVGGVCGASMVGTSFH